MKVLGEMWDKWLTQVSDWKEAEENAEEILEIMDFFYPNKIVLGQ